MDAVRFLNVEYIYTRLIDLFWNFDIVAILNAFIHFIEAIVPIGIVITLFFIYVIFYSRHKLKKMAKEDEEKREADRKAAAMSGKMTEKSPVKDESGINLPGAVVATGAAGAAIGANAGTSAGVIDTSGADLDLHNKWQIVQKNISSDNPSDWRVAIMEADIMLGDILTKRGYRGDTIGDQLKSVDPSDMLTLQDAWAAHKVRNNIAHGGTGFQINEREARATIDLFKKVFEEFYHL